MKPRPEVLWFAEQMEKKLRIHDTARNWDDTTLSYLFMRLHEEYIELKNTLVFKEEVLHASGCDRTHFTTKLQTKGDAGHVVEECVDLANFCMMIADRLRK